MKVYEKKRKKKESYVILFSIQLDILLFNIFLEKK